MATAACPACAAPTDAAFFALPRVPVLCNVLHDTRAAALAATRGDIALSHCAACGMIFNTAFDSGLLDYSAAYENSLHFSKRFQDFADALADRLTADHDLAGKKVLEIGCGKGDFLGALRQRGAHCLGFDASYDGLQSEDDGLEIVRSGWDPDRASAYDPDLVVCRHVLEHIDAPRSFLESVRGALDDRASIYFEVPDTLYTLRDLGIWDLIYEHCGYFTAPSLHAVFAAAGFTPRRLGSAFGGQFLWIEAQAAGSRQAAAGLDVTLDELGDYVRRFATEFETKVHAFGEQLRLRLEAGARVAVWGIGSKGVTFLNTVGGGEHVHAAVDINDRKLGKFVPGTGLEVCAPQTLAGAPVDLVWVMNPNYRDEIEVQLRSLGARAVIETV